MLHPAGRRKDPEVGHPADDRSLCAPEEGQTPSQSPTWPNEAPAESPEHLRLALEAGRMGTWQWDIATGRVAWSAQLEALHGLAPGTFPGTFEAFQSDIHTDDRKRVQETVLRTLTEGADHEIQYRIVRPDGEVRWMEGRGTLYRDAQGVPSRMMGVCMDVTDRKRAESALRESEERLRMAQDAAGAGVWEFDLASGEARWSEGCHRIYGTDPATFFPTYESWLALVHTEDRDAADRAVLQATADRSSFDIEFRIEHPRQGLRWVQEIGHAFAAPEGGTERIAGITLDVTERRQAVEALKEADRRKDEFLATLAHELRNPLAPIGAGLELLKLAKDDPATLEDVRDTMQRQTRQLIALVEDLLDVSRIGRGKLQLRRSCVRLSEVAKSALEAARPLIDQAGHELLVEIPEAPIELDADPHRLAQVLSNLLNNAARYTPAGGRVRLAAERQGSDVVVSVEDNGVGIAADKLESVFEMFAQIGRSEEENPGGLGIGLTLVKSLVELHGGRIEVHSDGPNRGSRFRVRLPILLDAPAAAPPPEEPETEVVATGLRVLVVDDNQAAAKMLGILVEMFGAEVRRAHDGQEAIQAAEAFRPDVVLMDIGMPRLNGYEAARRVRQEPWGKDTMLVALTGWGQDEDRQRAEEAGFDHHLVKPAEPSDLRRLFAELQRGRRDRTSCGGTR